MSLSSCRPGFILISRFDKECEAHEKVVVAVRRVDVEVQGLTGAVERARLFHFGPEGLAFGGTVCSVDTEMPGVYGGEETEAEL